VEILRSKGMWINVELSERDKDTDKQKRKERIKESRYNRKYERCMTEEIPEYLTRESAKERKIMARFRRARKQVLDGRGGKKEQNVHMWNECSEMREREREREKNAEKYE
jgi:hypothetical protein